MEYGVKEQIYFSVLKPNCALNGLLFIHIFIRCKNIKFFTFKKHIFLGFLYLKVTPTTKLFLFLINEFFYLKKK